jgi:hypothetical protein
VARLAEVDATGLSKNLKTGVDLELSRLAQMLIDAGFQGVDLIAFSEAGMARLAGVGVSSLVESLNTSVRINKAKLAEMLIDAGFESDRILAFF